MLLLTRKAGDSIWIGNTFITVAKVEPGATMVAPHIQVESTCSIVCLETGSTGKNLIVDIKHSVQPVDNPEINICLLDIDRSIARIGIDAPKSVRIVRAEITDRFPLED